jgi:sugar O-acyltransferase (sialic acid O-acetyltransferase NeuD family)
MTKKIIIVGSFLEIIELAEDSGYEIIGFIDNNKTGFYRNYKILSSDDYVDELDQDLKKIPLIITPDKPQKREKLYSYYLSQGFKFSSLISTSSKISKSATIGEGTVVQFGVNVSSEVYIGKFVKLNTYCNIMHNSVVGDFTTIAPNAVVLGNVKIGKNCYIGSNATILPNIEISDDVVVGAGAVVTKNVPPFSIVAGNPAKILKQFNNADEIQNYFRSRQKIK